MIGKNAVRTAGLTERLRDQIKREGPMSFRDWMQLALYDPVDGYYCRADRIRQGRTGDYRTAPETTLLFAATFAAYFAKLFAELRSPAPWSIMEVGAGRGEFAQGVLTTLQTSHARAFETIRYVIDEISDDARAQAVRRLSEFGDRVTFQHLSEIPKPFAAGIIFSNELIDAFPVHRVTMRSGTLRELCVDVSENNFIWIAGDPDARVKDYCHRVDLKLVEGQVAEINLDAEAYISRAGSLIEDGFVITVDYGAERDELLGADHRRLGTLRAFHRHQLIDDELSRPGEIDLTTTIDWTQIKAAGERAQLKTVRHERLDRFLLAEGLLDELEVRASKLPDADALRLRTSARELIMPHGLAASFQVLVQRKEA